MSRISSNPHSNTADSKSRSLKSPRFDDLKSPPKTTASFNTIKLSNKSPRQLPNGTSYAWISLKTPTERSNPIKTPTGKDIGSPEPKGFISHRKEPKKAGFTVTANIVGASAASKPENTQTKVNKAKSPVHARENVSNSKSRKNEDLSGYKDIKTPLATDTSEKSSKPANLKLTLEKVGPKSGSQTHRGLLNSPTSNCSARFAGISPIQKKKKVNPGSDVKVKSNAVNKSQNSENAKGQLNTLLVGLTKPSTSHTSKRSSQVNIKDASSVSVTPRQLQEGCIEEEHSAMKKYKELLGMLKEKNREIKKLSQDKSELQSTLSSVNEELKNLRRVNILFKERGKSAIDLQDCLGKLGIQSEDSSNLSQNGSVMLFQNIKGVSEKRSSKANNSSDCLQIGGRSSITTSPNEESLRQRFDTCEDNICIREFEDTGKAAKKKKLETKGSISGQTSPRKPKRVIPKKKKREATSVDQGFPMKVEIEDTDLEVLEIENTGKKRHPEFKSMTQFTFGVSKEGKQQNIDIGEALSELKNRVEKLLRSRNKMTVSKTQLLYQSLHDKLQKAQ